MEGLVLIAIVVVGELCALVVPVVHHRRRAHPLALGLGLAIAVGLVIVVGPVLILAAALGGSCIHDVSDRFELIATFGALGCGLLVQVAIAAYGLRRGAAWSVPAGFLAGAVLALVIFGAAMSTAPENGISCLS